MTTHGTIGEFKEHCGTTAAVTNDIRNAVKQHAILLSVVCGPTYYLICNLLSQVTY